MVPIKQGPYLAFQIQLQRCKTFFSLVKPHLLLTALTKSLTDSLLGSALQTSGDVGPLAISYKNLQKGS